MEAVEAVTARLGKGSVAINCLKAGKSIFSTKPKASTTEEAETRVAAQSKHTTYAKIECYGMIWTS